MLNETPFFLASAPVSALDRAKQLVTSHGGEYAAGDKDDIFNSMNLADQESWKAEACSVCFSRYSKGWRAPWLQFSHTGSG